MKNLLIYILILGSFFIFQCGGDNGDSLDCTGVISTYNGNAKAVIDRNCSTPGCHNSVDKAGQIDLSTYASCNTYLKRSSEKFLCSINHGSGCSKMPSDIAPNKMDAAYIKILECWIDNGFPE